MEDNKLNTHSVEFEYGNKTVKIETGKIARQATSSIIITIDNLVVLTTMVAKKEADPSKDFFPFQILLLVSPNSGLCILFVCLEKPPLE